jgi:RNA polymerase sigma-70 factor (ECF subfamily)
MRPDEFEAIVAELERPLGRFVAQMIPDRALAEDVLQETFCAAWRQRDRIPAEPSHRRAWLYAVARNTALQGLRKRRRGRRATEALALERAGDDPVIGEALALRDLLATTLAPRDQSLFLLRYAHGFSSRELADMTGMRPATVRKRLERAADALRAAITDTTILDEGHVHEQASVL